MIKLGDKHCSPDANLALGVTSMLHPAVRTAFSFLGSIYMASNESQDKYHGLITQLILYNNQ